MRLETFFTVSEQAELFLLSVCLGAALGVIFDAFRLLRAVFLTARTKAAVHVADFIFVCFYAFCIFLYSTVLSRGEVRIFVVIGSLCGFVLEVLTIGDYVTAFVRMISDKIHSFFHNIWAKSLNFRKKFRQDDKISPDTLKSVENT